MSAKPSLFHKASPNTFFRRIFVSSPFILALIFIPLRKSTPSLKLYSLVNFLKIGPNPISFFSCNSSKIHSFKEGGIGLSMYLNFFSPFLFIPFSVFLLIVKLLICSQILYSWNKGWLFAMAFSFFSKRQLEIRLLWSLGSLW